MTRWKFLTSHAHVIICLQRDPRARIRDLAQRVGITPRAVQRVLADLQAAGYVVRRPEGRGSHYIVRADRKLRHRLQRHQRVAVLLELAKDM